MIKHPMARTPARPTTPLTAAAITTLVATTCLAPLAAEEPHASAAFEAGLALGKLFSVAGGDGTEGVVLRGYEDGLNLGTSVALGGDLNGDGIDDLLIGGTQRGSGMGPGLVFVVYGRSDIAEAEVDLTALFSQSGGDGSDGFVIRGLTRRDWLGGSVEILEDFDGDGLNDLAMCARNANLGLESRAGECYILFGRAENFPPQFDLRSLEPANGGDGSAGVIITNDQAVAELGGSLADVGDINGDGLSDLAIGAPNAMPSTGRTRAGAVYVIYGNPRELPAQVVLPLLIDGVRGFEIAGAADEDGLGDSIDGGRDINGDGVDDLIVGAGQAALTPEFFFGPGEAYLLYGRTEGFPALIDVADLREANGGDGSRGVVFRGVEPGDRPVSSGGRLGSGAALVDDVNGDHIPDLLLGASSETVDDVVFSGRSYLIFGKSNLPAQIELATLFEAEGGDGSTGVVFGGKADGGSVGASVAGVGDMNGDGLGDVILAATIADAPGQCCVGKLYLLFGRDDFDAEEFLTQLGGGDGSQGVLIRGVSQGDSAGTALSGGGDWNGDGVDDVVIGAQIANAFGLLDAGEVYIVFGRSAPPR